MIKDSRQIIKIALLVIALCCIGYFVYLFGAFSLFEESNDKLKTLNINGKPYKIVLYRINGNATVQNGIQVRKIIGGEEVTLKHFDRYDSLVSFSLSRDKLKLILINTNIPNNPSDTLYLKLP
ncbi:MAG: hypothetical protein EOO42_07075 [Flavobacteriales bacterium]|nr:MAG: hypothetical protein EOO42_07075 [Flavobacteriales bacterium]